MNSQWISIQQLNNKEICRKYAEDTYALLCVVGVESDHLAAVHF